MGDDGVVLSWQAGRSRPPRQRFRDWVKADIRALIADKAFDSTAIIAELDARGAKVVISQHPRRTKHLAIDEAMYNGGTSLKTSSAESRSSNASPCAPTRPTKALPP
jgi:hypothetical protein